MDPASIVQIVGTAISLGDVVVKCIAGLRTLKSKYHEAPLLISTIIGQLYMVQLALDQLAIWNNPKYDRDPRYQQLATQVDNALDYFSPLILALEKRLGDFELNDGANMTACQRLAFLWGDQQTSEYSVLLDRQVNALNLLLQAVQCNTYAQQQDLLLKDRSQSIIRQAEDCSSSIIGLEDSTSLFSEDTAGISLTFDFDAVVLASKIYQRAGISHLRQSIRAQRSRLHNQVPAQDQPKHIFQGNISQSHATIRQSHFSISSSSETSSMDSRISIIHSPKGNTQTASKSHKISPGERNDKSATAAVRSPNVLANSSRLLHLVKSSRKTLSLNDIFPINSYGWQKFAILGTSGTGKTALIKGLRLAVGGSMPLNERLSYKTIIWHNVVMGVRAILEAMLEMEIPLHDQSNEYHASIIYMQPIMNEIIPSVEVVDAISKLWLDEGFQYAYMKRSQYALSDHIAYYVEGIQRLGAPDYVPTDKDVLWTRSMSTGTTEAWVSDVALLFGIQCLFRDVGEISSCEPYWDHIFPRTSVVLYTVDATAYGTDYRGTCNINGVFEQIDAFRDVVNRDCFTSMRFILIFTKIDLIGEWLREKPPHHHFVGYRSQQHPSADLVETYMQYLESQFLSVIRSPETAARIKIIRGDLVHNSIDTVWEVVRAINELIVKYPDGIEPFVGATI
ncbi:G-protein alpha subunit-domain-containing protein [Xylaria venustula]|nr:G-protein alpha subunit-domain-containing protein [Xylaria venustula]